MQGGAMRGTALDARMLSCGEASSSRRSVPPATCHVQKGPPVWTLASWVAAGC